MTKQNKKRFTKRIVGAATASAIMLFSCPHLGLEIDSSEIAEQNSVIDELATLTTLPTHTTEIQKNEMITHTQDTEHQVEEETTIPEVYIDGWTTTNVNVRKGPSTETEILDVYSFNTKVSFFNRIDGWGKIKYKDGYAYIKAEYINEVENIITTPYTELVRGLTEREKYLIYQITYLEAGDQCMAGQRAVIEVIFNRVLSPKFPNTVEGVLSQRNQFVTWAFKDKKPHNEEQVQALELVATEPPILTQDYLTFSMEKFSWTYGHYRIEDHWFGKY